MSYQDPTIQYPPPGAPEYQTMPLPQDDYVDDDDEEWVNEAPKGLRIPPITGILALVLFAVCGFWGGAVLQKHHDKSTRTTTTGAAAFAGLAAGRRAAAAAGATGTGTGAGTGATGAGGFGGRGGTVGTVSDVEGSTVFLTDSSGNILKVNLAPTTKVTKTTSGTAADIQLGDSVIVTGAKGTDGSTSASAVVIVPAATSGVGAGAATATTPTTTGGG